MDVNIHCSPDFNILYNPPEDTQIIFLIGGRGGKKTYEASIFITASCTVFGKRIQILRDEAHLIKESILGEVLARYESADVYGALSRSFTKLENGIKDKKTGEMVVFTKGFRASSLEKKANMKGVANVDIGVIEEGEDIRDEDKFNVYWDSVRKKGSFILFILNTPDINHWILRRHFNMVPLSVEDEPNFTEEELDGYFKIYPKGNKGIYVVQTDYTKNEHLPENVVDRYTSYGDRNSPNFNLHYYLTAIKGHANTGMKGQYFKKYKIITNEEYNSLDYQEVYGQDFGTTSPAGTIAMKAKGNKVYLKELNYEPLKLKPLAFKLDQLGLNSQSLIVADCAEPDTIRDLRFGLANQMSDEEIERYPQAAKGFKNIRPSPDKSIDAGLSKLLSMEIHVVEGSDNLLNEFAMYCEARDRNGIGTGKPIDNFNHLIDPSRYLIQVKGRWY